MTKFENLEIVRALWHDRPATLKECTEQLVAFLIKLKEHNPDLFGIWYETGWSRKQALQNKLEFSYASIKRLFSKRIKNDELYPETTYKASAWSGGCDEEAVSFMARLGTGGHHLYPNSFDLELPFKGTWHEYYKNPAHQEALINLVKDYWLPDRLMVKAWQGDFVYLL